MIVFTSITAEDDNAPAWAKELARAVIDQGLDRLPYSAISAEALEGIRPLASFAAMFYSGLPNFLHGFHERVANSVLGAEANAALVTMLAAESGRMGCRYGMLAVTGDGEGVDYQEMVTAVARLVGIETARRDKSYPAHQAEMLSRRYLPLSVRVYDRWREWVSARQELAESLVKESGGPGEGSGVAVLVTDWKDEDA